jgi:hypothetical protein
MPSFDTTLTDMYETGALCLNRSVGEIGERNSTSNDSSPPTSNSKVERVDVYVNAV